MRNSSKDKEERRKYYGDVEFEVWRRGGDPDAVDRDRLEDMRYEGLYSADAATLELRRHRRNRY